MVETLAWAIAGGTVAIGVGTIWLRLRRARYILEAPLPPGIFDKLKRARPDIDPAKFPRIAAALRDFYAVHLGSDGRAVGMPSRAVDALWHEHILYTRHYREFCRHAFGPFRFLHHTPATALSRSYDSNVALRRTWWRACKLEGLNPHAPKRLPRLFAIDAELGIADGFRYVRGPIPQRAEGSSCGGGCGSHSSRDFCDRSFDGTTDGLGDGSDGGGGCDGGCGGD